MKKTFFGPFSAVFTRPQKQPLKTKKSSEKISASDFLLREAQTKAREIILEARDEAYKIKREVHDDLEKKQKEIEKRQKEIEDKLKKIEEIKKQQLEKLERAAKLTVEEAKKLILDAVTEKLKGQIAKRIKESEEQIKTEADKKAKEILADAMQKAGTDYVVEYTVTTIKLPDEEMKGRIIGKEGRNIRALEKITGVDFEVDETPGEIRLSSFDPVRREIAKVSLERLMADGRIQPARIEEVVVKTKKDIKKIIFEAGEKLCHRVSVYNLPPDKIALLGRFKYRFSYGQNMISHTLEETKIGVALAQEIGADINVVRLGCLLHDIGKVIDEEGNHVQLAVDFLRKNKMPEAIIACVQEHHEDQPFSSIESVLVYLADAISGSRPGARYEDYEKYLKRLKDLEALVKKHKAVIDVYVFQAGREIRVIVNPEEIDDDSLVILAEKLREEIQKQMSDFPGQIRINVIREKRIIATTE